MRGIARPSFGTGGALFKLAMGTGRGLAMSTLDVGLRGVPEPESKSHDPLLSEDPDSEVAPLAKLDITPQSPPFKLRLALDYSSPEAPTEM